MNSKTPYFLIKLGMLQYWGEIHEELKEGFLLVYFSFLNQKSLKYVKRTLIRNSKSRFSVSCIPLIND